MILTETDRLQLCQFELADAPFIFELLNTPLWVRFIGDRGIKTLEDAENYLINGPIKMYETPGLGLYGVRLKSENTLIGMCGLLKRDFLDHPDIGFAFLPQHMGKGYAYEASLATLAHAKNSFGMLKVSAIVNHDNADSIRLLEKLGFHFQRIFNYPETNEELSLYVN